MNDKNILNIVELKDGIKITSNSYVGKIKIGELQINIRPKIEGMPLYQLLKYAYGLRDLALFAEALHNIDAFPFHDLLIYQLYAEAEDLIYRGLNKKYMREEKELETQRQSKYQEAVPESSPRCHAPVSILKEQKIASQ